MFRFDPFGRLESLVPAPWPHRLVRLGAVAMLVLFLVHRVAAYGTYLFKPLWVVETLIYVVFIVAYTVRADPVERSSGTGEVLVPVLGAVLPFALLFAPPARAVAGTRPLLTAVFAFMTASTAFTLWGLWTLRRAFSITVEARFLVTGGPYRWVRHPVYLGEILTAAAVALWRASVANAALFCLFVAVQLYRAASEEKKLGRALPGYRAWAARAWWP